MGLHLSQEQAGPNFLSLPNVPFADLACARFIHSVESTNMFISDLTGSGIGREVVLTLASPGAHALICADINMEGAKQTAEMRFPQG